MGFPVNPNISLRNILYATDFSPCSEAALAYAVGLSRRYQSFLTIVNVVPAEVCVYAQPPDPFFFRHSAEAKMAGLMTSDIFYGIKHQELIKEAEGDIPLVLCVLIRNLAIDLVVLGTHGRSGVKKVLLGSVSEEIIYSAHCPVLTVGPDVSRKSMVNLMLRRMLCATNLLPGSANALAYSLWLAQHEHAKLTVLHIPEMPSDRRSAPPEAASDSVLERLEQLVPRDVGISVEFIVEIGTPAERILYEAEHQGADLIVMGSHHTSHPRVTAHLPWVIDHQVLCHARCPVLTV